MNSVSTPTALTASAAALSYEHIAAFQPSFSTNPAYRIAPNAITQDRAVDSALNQPMVTYVPRVNSLLKEKLREGARRLRDAIAHGATVDDARETKQAFLQLIYRILAIHLGTPPTTVDWQWLDKDRAFHRDGTLTPQEFAAKYITLPLDEYVCLVHDPRDTSPYGRTFTVDYLGNVWEGGLTRYLTVELDLLKDIAMHTLLDGEPVWFGCDVGKMLRSE